MVHEGIDRGFGYQPELLSMLTIRGLTWRLGTAEQRRHYEPIASYSHRPLPYIIGTVPYIESDHVGLHDQVEVSSQRLLTTAVARRYPVAPHSCGSELWLPPKTLSLS